MNYKTWGYGIYLVGIFSIATVFEWKGLPIVIACTGLHLYMHGVFQEKSLSTLTEERK